MPALTASTTRFSYAEYERMADAGVFGYRRVELINGRVYRMAPQRDPHMIAITKVGRALERAALPSDWIISQGTMRLDAFSAPDPDFQWCPVPLATPEHLRPLPILLVEVSHTTYKHDRGVKLRKYAEHRIADYWIVNLRADRIEVYRDPFSATGKPADYRYRSEQYFTRGQSITPLLRATVSIAVDDLLP